LGVIPATTKHHSRQLSRLLLLAWCSSSSVQCRREEVRAPYNVAELYLQAIDRLCRRLNHRAHAVVVREPGAQLKRDGFSAWLGPRAGGAAAAPEVGTFLRFQGARSTRPVWPRQQRQPTGDEMQSRRPARARRRRDPGPGRWRHHRSTCAGVAGRPPAPAHILLGPGAAMHDVHTMKLGRWAPPWWGVGVVPAPPGHRCDQTGLPARL
jgi:hypothetical protein